MSLENAFGQLATRWHELHEAVQALRVTAVEDQPRAGAVVPVERRADAAEDLLGWASEGLTAAREAVRLVIEQPDPNRLRRSLMLGQQRFSRLEDGLAAFNSYESVTELVRFGRSRRGEWWAWVKSVRDAGARCEHPARELREALVQCWQELAERRGGTSVSVQTTNVGQQIEAGPELRESQRHGLT